MERPGLRRYVKNKNYKFEGNGEGKEVIERNS